MLHIVNYMYLYVNNFVRRRLNSKPNNLILMCRFVVFCFVVTMSFFFNLKENFFLLFLHFLFIFFLFALRCGKEIWT